jgi:hypothetical protein
MMPRKDLSAKDIETAARLFAMGVPVHQVAAKLKMSRATLERRMKEDPELLEVINAARAEANHKMSQSLYEQGLSGNTTAAIFWCKTQMGFRETSVIEHQGVGGGAIQYSNMTDEQIFELMAQTQARLAELAQAERDATTEGSTDGSGSAPIPTTH